MTTRTRKRKTDTNENGVGCKQVKVSPEVLGIRFILQTSNWRISSGYRLEAEALFLFDSSVLGKTLEWRIPTSLEDEYRTQSLILNFEVLSEFLQPLVYDCRPQYYFQLLSKDSSKSEKLAMKEIVSGSG